jgi:hypothetical protein
LTVINVTVAILQTKAKLSTTVLLTKFLIWLLCNIRTVFRANIRITLCSRIAAGFKLLTAIHAK